MSEFVGHATTDLAMQLLREGKIHECIACAEKVVEADMDNAKVYSILGAAYAQAGARGMAIAAFERSVAIKPSARGYYNLGKAYEQSGRMVEALAEYQRAVEIDPTYKAAVEALNRLSSQDTPTNQANEYQPHILSGDDGPTTSTAPDSTDSPESSISTPPDYEPDHSHEPVSLASEQDVTAEVDDQAGHKPLDGLQPVGVPAAPVPTTPQPGTLPDLSNLEMRAQETERKAKEAAKNMMKAGMIYGMIAGPVSIMGASVIARLLFAANMSITFALVEGLVIGAIIGLWVGYTCGDDITGAKVGAVLGLLGHGLPSLIGGNDLGIVAFYAVTGALIISMAGYFIGMMVENSIGQ